MRTLCSLLTVAVAVALSGGPAAARVISAKRTFAPPLRAAMKNVVRPAPDTRLTTRAYLQPAVGGHTLLSVASTVKGQPLKTRWGTRFDGGNAYYLVDRGGAVTRLTSWDQLQRVKLDRSASAAVPPATKIQLKPLTNGGAMLNTVGDQQQVRYHYLGQTGRVKQLTSWAQAQKVVEWIK